MQITKATYQADLDELHNKSQRNRLTIAIIGQTMASEIWHYAITQGRLRLVLDMPWMLLLLYTSQLTYK